MSSSGNCFTAPSEHCLPNWISLARTSSTVSKATIILVREAIGYAGLHILLPDNFCWQHHTINLLTSPSFTEIRPLHVHKKDLERLLSLSADKLSSLSKPVAPARNGNAMQPHMPRWQNRLRRWFKFVHPRFLILVILIYDCARISVNNFPRMYPKRIIKKGNSYYTEFLQKTLLLRNIIRRIWKKKG